MVRKVTAHGARELLDRGEVEIIDVRDAHEWSTGRIAGARLVPLDQLRASPRTVLARDGVLFVCAAGVRSETAARLASTLGLANVYTMTGGTRAWAKAGFALETDRLDVAV